MAVWREEAKKDAGFAPTFNVYTAGNGWGQASVIAGSEGSMEPSASVGLNASGQGVAAWTTEHSNGFRYVYVSRYAPGTGFEPAVLLDAGLNGGGGVILKADINDAGDIVVVWDRRDDEKSSRAMAAYFKAP